MALRMITISPYQPRMAVVTGRVIIPADTSTSPELLDFKRAKHYFRSAKRYFQHQRPSSPVIVRISQPDSLKQFRIPADPQEKIMRIPRNDFAIFREKISALPGKNQHFSGKNSALSQEKISTSQEKLSTLPA